MAFYRPASWQKPLSLLLLCAALALPSTLAAFGQEFYIGFATRVLIFALAASSLNLVLGFGGMVSLGHAAFLGAGAYAAAICQQAGINEALLAFPAAMGIAGLFALVVGAISLRTRGVYFIMITLAFAQMAYFASISLKRYGGEDGLPVNVRSQIGGLDMGDDLMFYLLVLAVLGLVLLGLHRLVHSRFGMALQGSRINERRMTAMGLPVFRYRLLAYVLSAEICVVAGVLLANLTRFVSPSYMQWSMSGELIVMVVLGGLGTLLGPVVGAASLIVLEEALSSLHLEAWPSLNRWVGDHWLAVVGIFIVLVTLNLHRGLLGSLRSSGDPT